MPDGTQPLRVLIIAPYLNRDGLGEVFSIFKWVEALSERCDVTVMAVTGDYELAPQLPKARVFETRGPSMPRPLKRLNHMAKPWLFVFFSQVQKWIRREQEAGAEWDIAHQVLPQAMRYASPLAGMGIPYVVGPLGGSLATPPAFQHEVTDGALVTRLRALDRWRLKRDRKLRRGYESAGMILGVAPYIAETLKEADVRVQRFEPVLERAHDGVFPDVTRTSGVGEAHLLHVGRVIRTKGLRDVIRALAHLKDMPGVHLTSAGKGPDLEACKEEAERLGVADRVTFLGEIPRTQVDELYASADVFCFPSFREPMGGVFFEAMAYALPVIAAARGGPDFILDDTSALKLPVENPEQYALAIADAIRRLANDPALRKSLGDGAAARLRSFGTWPERAEHLETLYRSVLAAD